MSGGVESEAAEAVCAQCGARLVSSSSLEERQDLLEFFRNKRGRELEEDGRSDDYQATTQGSLQRHIQSTHEGIKYPCNQCDSQFTQQSHLKIHILCSHK